MLPRDFSVCAERTALESPRALPGDAELLDRIPGLPITNDNVAHYRGYFERRLLINRCELCGHRHHPPRLICPNCWSDRINPTEVSGSGVIYLLMWLHQGPEAPGVTYDPPHPVVTVELDEQPGLRFSSTVVNASSSEIRIGRRVRLAWIERAGVPWPVFSIEPS